MVALVPGDAFIECYAAAAEDIQGATDGQVNAALAELVDQFQIGEREPKTMFSIGKLDFRHPLWPPPRNRQDRSFTEFGMSDLSTFTKRREGSATTGQQVRTGLQRG